MSYLVFARKWRPNTFEEVVGQEHVTQTLIKAIEKNRVAHAYIFTGTRGVGKTTLARIMARALNCDKGPTAHPCGVCESCTSILTGSSFDVLEIDGASNNSVDDIRELRENIGYSSMAGKYRIYVIDEVHMLSKQAFNALLKTLEEPPPKVIFILATTEPHKIPQTIQSRCQRYDFRRISTEKIEGQLAKICAAESIVCDKGGLALIARKADGSMRDALSLLDQVFSYGEEKLAESDVRTILGLVDADLYRGILKAVAAVDPAPALDVVHQVLANGLDLSEFVLGLEEFLRDLLFARMPNLEHGASDLAELAARFQERTILRMSEIVRNCENELRFSSFPRFCVETMLLKLVYLDDTVTLQEVLRSLGNASPDSGQPLPSGAHPGLQASAAAAEKKKVVQPPAPPWAEKAPAAAPVLETAPPPPAEPAEPVAYPAPDQENDPTAVAEDPDFDGEPPSALDESEGLWPDFLHHLVEDWPRIGSMLSAATLVSSKGSTIELRFGANGQFQFQEVTNKKNRDHILAELEKHFGKPIDLHMTIESRPPEPAAPAPAAARPQSGSIQDDIEREPIIQSVLEMFDGEVLD